jgi:FKBP-type peptidyl-prolyl cis-trans isomerase SlpA
MSEKMLITVGSHVTLHYRVTLTDQGSEVISTFGQKPATISPGYGQLAEPLERCLLGLGEGDQRSFELAAGQAYGPRNPDLIRRVSRQALIQQSEETDYAPGDLVEFPTPDGGRYAGVLKQLDQDNALFDFNHPLAGRPIRFDVHIIGVL